MRTLIVRPTTRFFWSTVFLLAAMPTGIAQAQDWVRAERESAKSWGMHRIAVIQAAEGDVQDAKRTLSQIGEDGPPGPSQVTVVSFWNGQPIYESFSAEASTMEESPGWGGRDAFGTQYFLAQDRPADRVPTELPAGLPSDYLDPDPRHGAVVDFTDEYDSRGTRVTSRKYADGYAVLETPRASDK